MRSQPPGVRAHERLDLALVRAWMLRLVTASPMRNPGA
jgi:hypothetical protein